ncbi:MAG TPA: molybdenum ABC transporter ATP-binding protein [Dongiaceae bacterium]
MLTVRANHRLGDFDLKVDVTVPSRGITALFGRSGAGKSSVVNLLAGLLQPDDGFVQVNGTVLFDSASGISVAPEHRRLGYVFQEGRLFPHLSVRGNLLFGQRRTPAPERRIGFDEVVALVDIAPLLHRRPRDLSGGEKQRIAIGRALLASPKLLLMDEPLASLDAARKNEIVPFIEKLRDSFDIPIVYVTHDLGEIVRLADRVVLMANGAAVFTGSVEDLVSRIDMADVMDHPEAEAVIAGHVAGHDDGFGLTRLTIPGAELQVRRMALAPGAAVRVRLRARDVAIALSRPTGVSVLNVLPVRIAEIVDRREQCLLRLTVSETPPASIWAGITARSRHDLGLQSGQQVYAMIKAVAVEGSGGGEPDAARTAATR